MLSIKPMNEVLEHTSAWSSGSVILRSEPSRKFELNDALNTAECSQSSSSCTNNRLIVSVLVLLQMLMP